MDNKLLETLGDDLTKMVVPMQKYIFEQNYKTVPEFNSLMGNALTALYDQGPMRPTDLARYLGISNQRLTRPLKMMISSGYVQQSDDAQNKKIVWLSVTEKGSRTQERIIMAYMHNLRIRLSVLTEEEMSEFAKAARLINEILDKIANK